MGLFQACHVIDFQKDIIKQGRPGEVAEYRIPVFKYLKIPDTHVETG